jgi:flagellar basal-body rod protein FlgG
MQALYTAATGMNAQQMNIDTISNNLANENTDGFKEQRVEFQDLMYINVKKPGTPTTPDTVRPVGIQIGEGVKPVATQRIFTEGSIQNTNNPLDLLIQGSGFFQLTDPNGNIVYTRDGAFEQDANGNIVNAEGYKLNPPVQIPANTTSISINSAGAVYVQTVGSTQQQQVGQIELAQFVNPDGLVALGNNDFTPSAASGNPEVGIPGQNGFPTIQEGSLELSNVNTVEQMVNLIVAQEAYDMNAKAVQTADTMLSTVAQLPILP